MNSAASKRLLIHTDSFNQVAVWKVHRFYFSGGFKSTPGGKQKETICVWISRLISEKVFFFLIDIEQAKKEAEREGWKQV